MGGLRGAEVRATKEGIVITQTSKCGVDGGKEGRREGREGNVRESERMDRERVSERERERGELGRG